MAAVNAFFVFGRTAVADDLEPDASDHVCCPAADMPQAQHANDGLRGDARRYRIPSARRLATVVKPHVALFAKDVGQAEFCDFLRRRIGFQTCDAHMSGQVGIAHHRLNARAELLDKFQIGQLRRQVGSQPRDGGHFNFRWVTHVLVKSHISAWQNGQYAPRQVLVGHPLGHVYVDQQRHNDPHSQPLWCSQCY